MYREARALLVCDPESLFKRGVLISSTTGLRLANLFHPRMWHVQCTRYRSPYQTFQNDSKLERVIEKALRIWPDRYGARASCLRRILKSFSDTVGVSNFRPTAAKALINRYCQPGGRVLDFSAGYGGRLLGAMSLNRSYTGIDAARAQVQGLRVTVRRLRRQFSYTARAKIVHGSAEDELKHLRSGSFDLVFSSPPYFNREKYSFEKGQSFVRYPKLDVWIDHFLRPVIVESARVLRDRGFLVINVHNNCEPVAQTVRRCTEHILKFHQLWQMQLAKLPYKRNSARDAYKTEPVLVFQKLNHS